MRFIISKIFLTIYILLFIGKTKALRCFTCEFCYGSISTYFDDQRIIDCNGYCYVGYLNKFLNNFQNSNTLFQKSINLRGKISKGCLSECKSETQANGNKIYCCKRDLCNFGNDSSPKCLSLMISSFILTYFFL